MKATAKQILARETNWNKMRIRCAISTLKLACSLIELHSDIAMLDDLEAKLEQENQQRFLRERNKLNNQPPL